MIDQFKKFCKSQNITVEQSDKYEGAFYSHALGIQILRHPTVMKYYSVDKKKYLKHAYDNKELIDNWIKENVKLTIVRLPGSINSNTTKLTSDFLPNLDGDVVNLINFIMSHKNRLLSLLNRSSNEDRVFFDKGISSLLKKLGTEVSTDKFKFTFKLEELEFNPVSIEMIIQDSKCKELRNKIKVALVKDQEQCKKCFQLSTNDNVLFTNEIIKSKTREELEKLPDSLAKTVSLKYYNSLTKGSVTKNFKQDIETKALQIALETIKDEIQLNTTQFANELNLSRDELLVSGLLKPATANDVKVIIQRNLDHTTFLNSLLDNLRASRSDLFRQHGIERVILSPGHLFDLSKEEKDFFPRFLATLNLCNRSSRRYLRNRHDDNLKRQIEAEHPKSWKFRQSPNWPAFDNHKFTTTGKRNDETLELAGYNVVYDLITWMKKNLNEHRVEERYLEVTDKVIASWIRDIIEDKDVVLTRNDGTVVEIKKFKKLTDMMVAQLIKITYLLFGSEVMRNPASLIHHQMMIDLILDGMMTWKDALDSKRKIKIKKTNKVESDGGEMPMSMKEAVASARILHKRFLPFIPHPYYYDPLEDDDAAAAAREEELRRRENAIYEKWFTQYMWWIEDTDEVRLVVLSDAVSRWYGLKESDDTVDRLTTKITTPPQPRTKLKKKDGAEKPKQKQNKQL